MVNRDSIELKMMFERFICGNRETVGGCAVPRAYLHGCEMVSANNNCVIICRRFRVLIYRYSKAPEAAAAIAALTREQNSRREKNNHSHTAHTSR